MGGFVSRAAEAPVDEKGYPRVHVPTGRRLSGRPRVGSFSAGPKTLTKLRTRSDFCLVKIFEEKIVLKAFQLWCKDEKCAEASTFLSFISSVDSGERCDQGHLVSRTPRSDECLSSSTTSWLLFTVHNSHHSSTLTLASLSPQ